MPWPPDIIYFHGLPGTPDELQLFGQPPIPRHFAPDRTSLNLSLCFNDHLDVLANQISQRQKSAPIRLVGFSIGAFIALQIAHRLPDSELMIDLVSPAAPLASVTNPNDIAGNRVFQMALKYPMLFAGLVMVQSIAARRAPRQVFKTLFASAQGDDRGLCEDQQFRDAMMAILNHSLGDDPRNYRREIGAYVQDWAAILPAINQPVRIWQGAKDNWTPPEMAAFLADKLPNIAAYKLLPNASHYSALAGYWADQADTPP